MIIFKMDIKLSEFDTQSNVKIPFEVTERFEELVIHFTYSPNKSSDEVAQMQVKEALAKYALSDYDKDQRLVDNYLPVDNLITLSLSKNGQYLGAHHNKRDDQTIVISNDKPSYGFWPVEVEPAEWELQLNCHCVASHLVEACVRIEAR